MADANPLGVGEEKGQEQEQGSSEEQDTTDNVKSKVQSITADSSINIQEILDQILQFLTTTSSETLGACLVGLGAITYFILGRIGLVLIGIVGGVVLHATWEEKGIQFHSKAESAEARARKRREDELAILQRILNWRGEHDGSGSDINGGFDPLTSYPLDSSEFEPATGAALTALTDAVIRDYVKWWYGPLVPDDVSFPSTCRQIFTKFLVSIASHLSRKRPADVFLDFLTNSSSIFIVFLNELASALTASAYSGLQGEDALHQYLEQNPSSSLANVLDLDQQRRKLKAVSEDILQSFLDPKAYACEPVRIFLRQILASVCLEMTIQSCSKPEWINGWIVYWLEQDEAKLIDTIDAGIGGTGTTEVVTSTTTADVGQHQASSPVDNSAVANDSSHKRTVSRAEEAMDEAMQEAQRLSEMIAAEEAKKAQGNEDALSFGTTTGGGPTPTSSQSDFGVTANGSSSDLAGDGTPESQLQQAANAEPLSSFTNFDQLLGSHPPTALQPGHTRSQSVIIPLTLHNASISIFDDAMPGEKGTIRTKPTVDYLLQVEPASSQHPGWMIARKYADFETLHEVLRRISVISGVPEFADRHTTIPGWKNRSKDALRIDLERYIRDALSFNRLAESEGMKRFLEKDQGVGGSSPSVKQGGFGFPTPAAFESMGKGMLDVLSAAPKGAAGGGRAILGGVTGVLGGVGSLGQKKEASLGNNKSAQSSNANLIRAESNNVSQVGHVSQDLPRASFSELDRAKTLPLKPASHDNQIDLMQSSRPVLTPTQNQQATAANDTQSKPDSSLHSPALDQSIEIGLHLPPPPSEIPDDWSTSPAPLPPRKSTSTDDQPTSTSAPISSPNPSSTTAKPPKPPLTEAETRVAIELFFATITSLYTLSSAWSIRRTLLTAAKNFLLRPGNPNLDAIRQLLQRTLIDANIADSGVASYINSIRANALPTASELQEWPPPMGEEEKERLRVRARRLLVERGMPAALTGVMGGAASAEAVGRVFDAVQMEEVARGVVGAVVLLGVRAVVL
ncbi:MAG: hypothetical protein Q9182_002154 [Xanthomendoza sp. 2 TL-2023]